MSEQPLDAKRTGAESRDASNVYYRVVERLDPEFPDPGGEFSAWPWGTETWLTSWNLPISKNTIAQWVEAKKIEPIPKGARRNVSVFH